MVAALGTADSNPHRAVVSLLGMVVSVMWWICSREALAERTAAVAADESRSRRTLIMAFLPLFFVASWAVSVVAHLMLWNKPIGHF
ncbi:MAG: hypothetical protein U0791_24315 [Gemmataceae bacterium]